MKRTATILFLILLSISAGCSGRTAYDSLRYNQDLRCQEMQGSDRNDCMQRNQMSYDEYQRQLKERDQKK
ncbi:MAG: hypothetical protein M0042_09660 [Nitrospiraceae bacterium]|nr:hypothetical protein [Nitrospiraceae bacterium]